LCNRTDVLLWNQQRKKGKQGKKKEELKRKSMNFIEQADWRWQVSNSWQFKEPRDLQSSQGARYKQNAFLSTLSLSFVQIKKTTNIRTKTTNCFTTTSQPSTPISFTTCDDLPSRANYIFIGQLLLDLIFLCHISSLPAAMCTSRAGLLQYSPL
jgi:hypothetical protein